MKALLNRLRGKPKIFWMLVVSSFFINLLALASSLYVIQVLNRYISHGVSGTLYVLSIGTLIAVALEFGFRLVRHRFADALSMKPDEANSIADFNHLSSAHLSALSQISAGFRSQFIGASETLQQAFSAPNISTVLDLPFALLFIFVLSLLSPELALIATFLSVLVLLVSIYGMKGVAKATGELTVQKGENARHVASVMNAEDTVRAFNTQDLLHHKWVMSMRGIHATLRKISARRGLIQAFTQSAAAIMTVGVISIGALMVVDAELDVGVLIGANILATRALSSVSRFATLTEVLARANQTITFVETMRKMPLEPVVGTALGNYSGKIAFNDLAFTFPKRKTPLFESLNLELSPGSVLWVAGNNGTGKTTFCRLLMGLVEPQRGEVLIDGVEQRQIVPAWWRQQVCYLPQDPTLINASLKENLTTLNPDITDEELNIILDQAGLRSFVSESPDGFHMRIDENGKSLSTGIRRRIALARALTSQSKVIVFDEPTEGLDEEGCQKVYDVLNKFLEEKRTIVISSNDPRITRAAHIKLDLNRKPIPEVIVNKAMKKPTVAMRGEA